MAENNNDGMKCSFFAKDLKCGTIKAKVSFKDDDLQPIDLCDYNVLPYLRQFGLVDFGKSSHLSEKDLILNRAAEFMIDAEPILRHNITVCPYHRYKFGIGFRLQSKKCMHPNHKSKREGDQSITKSMSENIRLVYQDVVPMGRKICKICRCDSAITGPSKMQPEEENDALNDSQASSSVLETTMDTTTAGDLDFETEVTEEDHDVTAKIRETANSTFDQLASALNESATEQAYVLTGDYMTCDNSTKHTLKAALRERCLLSAKALAPNHYQDLIDDFVSSEYRRNNNAADDGDDVWVKAVSELLPSLNMSEKIMVLSVFAYSDTKKHLVDKLNCSERIIRAARKHAIDVGAGKQHTRERIVRHRLSPELIEHFLDFLFDTQLQTMFWGEMQLKFSDLHTEEVAPVLRKNIPSHIIHLYYTYCKREMPQDFKPLSYTTLWKILQECPATTRKSLSGLDDIMAEGLSGFVTLQKVVDTLQDNGVSADTCKKYKTKLDESKQYHKGQFIIDVSADSSNCADHCRAFALSDPKDPKLRKVCDHPHDRTCVQCETMKLLFDDLERETSSLCDKNISKEVQYDSSLGIEQIQEWKRHILRSNQQQLGKDEILKSLSNEKALLIIDWGMKNSQEYLEKSKNWYGKKGMSWAFACVIYKEEDKLKKLTYTVCVEKCTQDWWSNCAVFHAVLEKIRADLPHIVKIIDKHDNAGCYHNAFYWLAKKDIADQQDIKLVMTLMNEPCKGKDECDRMISKCRNHLRYFVNAGNKVTSAIDMRNGLVWMDGVKGVSVAAVRVDSTDMPDKSFPFNVADVTKMFVLEYKEDHMLVRRAYSIGAGRRVEYPTNQKIYQKNFEFLLPFSSLPQNQEPGTVTGTATSDNQQQWHCPSSGCQRVFKSMAALRRHNNELCTYEVKRTSMDTVKRAYADKLEVAGQSSVRISSESDNQLKEGGSGLEMGWALKSRKPAKRFTPTMHS